MTEDLIVDFDRAMYGILDRAAALKPPLTFPGFRSLLAEHGGKRTAEILLAQPNVSNGFTKLVLHSLETGKPDALRLAVEYLILEQPWRQLFTPAQQRIAQRRLREVGCEPPSDSDEVAESSVAGSTEREANAKRHRTKRIRELPAPARRHSKYAEIIASKAWVPLILCDAAGCYWNTFTVQGRDGRTHGPISEAARQHLVSMLQAGDFGEEAMNAFVDHQRWDYIHDNLLDMPKPDVINRDRLRILALRRSATADGELTLSRDAPELALSLGPTTGPRPTSWTGVVFRDASERSHAYVFRFGDRNLWKIGHAMDVQARLADVNKHVPFEVLGEQWRVYAFFRCNSQEEAYLAEQTLLHLLRTATSVGERVICTREALEIAWRSVVENQGSASKPHNER